MIHAVASQPHTNHTRTRLKETASSRPDSLLSTKQPDFQTLKSFCMWAFSLATGTKILNVNP